MFRSSGLALGAGGVGGGGNGGAANAATAGGGNTGGGGGGSWGVTAAAGGSGIVIIRYPNTFKDAVSVSNGTKTTANINSTGLSTNSINVGRWNNPTGTPYYTTKQCRFASSGEGFSDTDATNYTNRVNTLMTYFGINTF